MSTSLASVVVYVLGVMSILYATGYPTSLAQLLALMAGLQLAYVAGKIKARREADDEKEI